MFTLKIDGVSYGVRTQYRPVNLLGQGGSRHVHFAEVDTGYAEREGHDSIRTVVQILKLNDENRTSQLICEGSATCTLADKFVKSEGRERAFKKAVDRFTSFRPVRTAFWNAYWANHKNNHSVKA